MTSPIEAAYKEFLHSKTRNILGVSLRLTIGRRYLASQPMLTISNKRCYVKITDITDGPNGPVVETINNIHRLTADDFLRAFNNGKMSFEGRIWK